MSLAQADQATRVFLKRPWCRQAGVCDYRVETVCVDCRLDYEGRCGREVSIGRKGEIEATEAEREIANWRATARSTISVEISSMQFGTKSQLVL
jgi:hypothetical protein